MQISRRSLLAGLSAAPLLSAAPAPALATGPGRFFTDHAFLGVQARDAWLKR
jgi:hypothetical protein